MRAKPIPMDEQYQLILECRQSGLSDYNWCLEKGINPGTFYNWVKRLRQIGTYDIPKAAGRSSYKPTPRQDIVKVELMEEPVRIHKPGSYTDQDPPSSFSHSIELHLGNASILVANDADPILLARTIQLLQDLPSC